MQLKLALGLLFIALSNAAPILQLPGHDTVVQDTRVGNSATTPTRLLRREAPRHPIVVPVQDQQQEQRVIQVPSTQQQGVDRTPYTQEQRVDRLVQLMELDSKGLPRPLAKSNAAYDRLTDKKHWPEQDKQLALEKFQGMYPELDMHQASMRQAFDSGLGRFGPSDPALQRMDPDFLGFEPSPR